MPGVPDPSDAFVLPWWQWLTVPTAAAALAAWALLMGESGRRLHDAPRRELGGTLLTLGVGFVLFFLGQVLAGAAMQRLIPPGQSLTDGTPTQVGTRMILIQLIALGPAVLLPVGMAVARPRGMYTLGLTRPPCMHTLVVTLCGLIVGLLVVSALLTITSALGAAMGSPPPMIQHELLYVFQRARGDWAGLMLLLMGTVVLAPLLEELMYRGLLQTTLNDAMGWQQRWSAILITAALFGFIHAGIASPHALPALIGLGVVLGWCYERTGNLWVPIAIHAGFNAANVAATMASTQ